MASENVKRTFMNPPYGIIEIDVSPACIRSMAHFLMEKYKDRTEADITSPDLGGYLREFADGYKDGVVVFRKGRTNILGDDVNYYEITELSEISLS